ncbi:hypothetical protein AA700_0834 [Acidiphilium acidophilum DSM 700]|nr:hypothetical protein AA700_0834 [Acidiphilium acidophilum DSM 700]
MTLGDQFVNNSLRFGNILPYQGLGTVYGGLYRFENNGVVYQPSEKVTAFLTAEFCPHAGGYDHSPTRGNG